MNAATEVGSSSTGVGRSSMLTVGVTTSIAVGGPPPIHPLNSAGGNMYTRWMVSSGGVFGPGSVAPPSCSVTVTQRCHVSVGKGSMSGSNTSYLTCVHASVGAIPDPTHTGAYTASVGLKNFCGKSFSPDLYSSFL